jgi:hypothetical protein
MRKVFWAVSLAIGAVMVKKQWEKRAGRGRGAQNNAARSNWANEGGAPGPVSV